MRAAIRSLRAAMRGAVIKIASGNRLSDPLRAAIDLVAGRNRCAEKPAELLLSQDVAARNRCVAARNEVEKFHRIVLSCPRSLVLLR